MEEIESHSSDTSMELRRFLIPSWLDVILYLAISAVIMVALNWHTIWSQTADTTAAPNAVGQAVSERFNGVGNFLNQPLFGKLSLLIFWAFVGCGAYMLLWLIQYSLAVIHEDFEETSYIHPGSFNEKGYWRSVAAHNIFLVCAVFVTIAYAFIAIRELIPLAAKIFNVGLASFPHVGGYIELFASTLITAFLLFVGLLLWRILRGVWGLNKVPEE